MATAVNDITGALITTKGKSTTAYGDNYDRIFRNKKSEPAPQPHTVVLGEGRTITIPTQLVESWSVGTTLEIMTDADKLIVTKR